MTNSSTLLLKVLDLPTLFYRSSMGATAITTLFTETKTPPSRLGGQWHATALFNAFIREGEGAGNGEPLPWQRPRHVSRSRERCRAAPMPRESLDEGKPSESPMHPAISRLSSAWGSSEAATSAIKRVSSGFAPV